jgi:hypothetical protein
MLRILGRQLPKALYQSGNVASHHPTLIKKNISNCFARFCSMSDIFTKPLRFRFGSASCFIVQLFF